MKDTKSSIFLKKGVATYENFQALLKWGPRILHISCHGALKEKLLDKKQLIQFSDEDKAGTLLVFEEKKTGGSRFIPKSKVYSMA